MPEKTPAAWLDLLAARIDERWKTMQVFDAYYEGDHQLNFASTRFREAFGSLFRSISDNWCPIVVDSSSERLEVQGFRFGKQQDADEAAWDIWQANNMDAVSEQVQTEAIKLGEAYWLVQPRSGDDPPRITAEHPCQMIVAHAPGDRRTRLAALKKWVEDDRVFATLYLPNEIHKFQSQNQLGQSVGRSVSGGAYRIDWMRRRDDPGGTNSLGEVPVIPVCNSPSIMRSSRSDLSSVVDLQNAVNKLLSDMLIGSEYQSFPMRVLLGVDNLTDAAGNPITAKQLEQSPARVWTFPDPESKIAEFSASDLDNYINASKHLVTHLTAQTRTPPHYVLGEIVNASGDALKAAETGLVSKVRRKMKSFGEAHEEVLRLAFKSLGDEEKATVTNAETIWRDPESRSQAEVVDAAVKKQALGVPWEQIMEDVGYSPQQIDRMAGMKEAEAIINAVNQPPQPVPPMNGDRAVEPAFPPANR